ncbi:MAG: META domain-containing protein [Propionicimonas sp.]|uniref:META domain-containing protein n=1 Tax=Propionicimonas sp. TaxID=1955623 RepID=UPI003D1082E2
MSDIEERFRAGLREAVAREPGLGPVDVDDVLARAEAGAPHPVRRRAHRWLGAAAALALVAGVGAAVWLGRTPDALPAVPAGAPSGSATPPASSSAVTSAPGTPVTAVDQLTGRRWYALELGGQAVTAEGVDVPSLKFFAEGGLVEGNDSCNNGSGRYSLDGTRLAITNWASSGQACDDTALPQRFLDALFATVGAQRAGTELELLSASGQVVARFGPRVGDAVEVRVRNASGIDFTSVDVQFPDGMRVEYGPLAAGASSDYADAGEPVYRYASVKVTAAGGPPADGRTFVLQPTDYVGEEALGPGEYTYVLTIQGDQLELTFE